MNKVKDGHCCFQVGSAVEQRLRNGLEVAGDVGPAVGVNAVKIGQNLDEDKVLKVFKGGHSD